MTTIRLLLALSSISLAAFFALICFGTVSELVFLFSAASWILLLAVKAYTPRRAAWVPLAARTAALKGRFALPLAV